MNLAITFALVATRMAAFIVASPFPGAAIPSQVRIGFVVLLSVATTPLVTMSHPPSIGLPLVMAAIGEMLTGAAIGFLFRVAMGTAEVLGSSLAHAMGLTFAASYDPSQATNSDALTRIVSSVALLTAFAFGAHRVVLGAVIGSFRAIPVGGFLDLATYVPGTLTWIARSLEAGVGLAVPAMTVSVVVQVAIGLVARAAPSLQVFSVGLSVSLASGLFVVLAGMRDSLAGLASHVSSMGQVLERVIAPSG